MKKSMLRIASVLLVAVMLTTCIISGAFAKYITTNPGQTDTAIVADWGVTITIAGDLFEDEYAVSDEDASISVKSKAGTTYELVAPGTDTVTPVTMEFTGTPEVSYNVTKSADLTLTGFTVDSEDYCPIIFTVNNVDIFMVAKNTEDASAIDTVAELETAVENAIKAGNGNYVPNTNLADTNGDTAGANQLDVSVSWRWNFEKDASLTGHVQSNEKDTLLGNAAAQSATAPSITLVVSAEVAQLD